MPHASSHRRRDGSALPFEFRAAPPPGVVRLARQRSRPGGRAAARRLGPAATSLALALCMLAARAQAASPSVATTGVAPEMQSTYGGEVARVLGVQVDPAWKATFYDPDPNGCLLVRQQVDSTLGIVVYDAVLLRTYQRFELRSVWP